MIFSDGLEFRVVTLTLSGRKVLRGGLGGKIWLLEPSTLHEAVLWLGERGEGCRRGTMP